MATSTDAIAKEWPAPGPGAWELEGAHFPKPLPHFGREAFIEKFKEGFAEGTARYGLLLSHFEIGIVNGFWYQQPAPFGAPKGAKGPPPAPILWLLTRLHPKMRKRIATSAKAFEEKLWREDLRRWDTEDKPAALSRHRALLAVRPEALDTAGLAAHLADCERHFGEMILLHHRYTIPSCFPVGDLLVHVSDWTGKTPGEILQLLRGSTPVSLGFSAAELRALADAIRADGSTRALLDGGTPAHETLEALRSASEPVGRLARDFLDLVWHRAVSYDLGDPATGEMPELVVAALRAALAGNVEARAQDHAARLDALRAQIPEAHRARFDELLAEARGINRLRDERGLFADCWAVGITRRALLEVGRRLHGRGLLEDPTHAVDLTREEAQALLAGRPGPSAKEIGARVHWRKTRSVADAPPHLNGQPAAPPSPSLLPPAARRAARAVDAVITNLFKEAEASSSETVIRGLSVNDGVYEGTARLVRDASEFGRLRQGDVLVTRATAPYFNVVLPLLGALVTDRGGQLCHAAIVAREYGIPGVVGTREATARIPDGARVRVDGTTGEVRVLSR